MKRESSQERGGRGLSLRAPDSCNTPALRTLVLGLHTTGLYSCDLSSCMLSRPYPPYHQVGSLLKGPDLIDRRRALGVTVAYYWWFNRILLPGRNQDDELVSLGGFRSLEVFMRTEEQETAYSDPNMSEHGPRTQIQVTLNNLFYCGDFTWAFAATEEDKSMYYQSHYWGHQVGWLQQNRTLEM